MSANRQPAGSAAAFRNRFLPRNPPRTRNAVQIPVAEATAEKGSLESMRGVIVTPMRGSGGPHEPAACNEGQTRQTLKLSDEAVIR